MYGLGNTHKAMAVGSFIRKWWKLQLAS